MAQRDSQPRIEDVTRVVLRPIASPLPLGFFAFGIGSVLQSTLQFGLIPQADVQNLALLFGAFGGSTASETLRGTSLDDETANGDRIRRDKRDYLRRLGL